MIYLAGNTSISVDIMIIDDTGLPITGLVAATFPSLIYSLAGSHNDVAFPALSDLAALTTAYVSGGVKERGNGYYRLDVPNGAFVTGGVVTIRGEASGKHILAERLHIVAFDPQDSSRLGLSRIDTLALEATAQSIKSKTDNLPSDPADESLIVSATDAIYNRLGAPVGVSLSADIAGIFTKTMTESYGAKGAIMTPAQALYEICQLLEERSISGTTLTIKKRDGVTTAFELSLDDGSAPTTQTRS